MGLIGVSKLMLFILGRNARKSVFVLDASYYYSECDALCHICLCILSRPPPPDFRTCGPVTVIHNRTKECVASRTLAISRDNDAGCDV